ncbi:MAG: AI-2E family transporter [Alphaproteobacteria bacterium]|nr:AI-2E family transporter [Alphaproteobacteria bacterium]
MTEVPPEPGSSEVWSKTTRDRWFLAFLALATAGVAILFWPFFYVLLFAATTTVVTWPVYERVLRRVRGRSAVASVLTVVLLALVIFGPLGVLMWLFVNEAIAVVDQLGDYVAQGELETQARALRDEYLPSVLERYGDLLPEDFDLVGAIVTPLQQALLQLVNSAGSSLPGLLNRLVSTGIDAVIFVFAVLSFYMEGPKVLTVLKNLTPMEDDYLERLFAVFREFANNMVVGSLATAALQGLVASVGYLAVGVERVVFLGICTAVFSFVPMVGTLVVWLPVCLYVGATSGWAWAAGLAVWNLAVTGSVDNVVKPLFLRGSSQIHPLLIFLAVFGGLSWMSVPGVLVGPVIVAFFLALYTIYREDWLGQPRGERSHAPVLIERMLQWLDPQRTETGREER